VPVKSTRLILAQSERLPAAQQAPCPFTNAASFAVTLGRLGIKAARAGLMKIVDASGHATRLRRSRTDVVSRIVTFSDATIRRLRSLLACRLGFAFAECPLEHQGQHLCQRQDERNLEDEHDCAANDRGEC
jgi:hypothetical protein